MILILHYSYNFTFKKNVTEEQALDLLDNHTLDYLFSSQLWKSKIMKLYIAEDNQSMFTETLRNEAIVQSIGTEDEEEKDKTIKEPEEEPENETKDLDTTENELNDTETPGFEMIVSILAVSFILLLKKKKTS